MGQRNEKIMVSPLGVQKFLDSELADTIRAELQRMVDDPQFNTENSYSPSSVERLEFIDKHMGYLSRHLSLNPNHYLSNLRLMTRINK